MDTNIWTVVSMILSVATSGGFIITIATLKSSMKKASAEARTIELGNLADVIETYKKLAVDLRDELNKEKEIKGQMVNRQKTIQVLLEKIYRSNTHILRKLNQITPDNLNEIVDEITTEIKATRSTVGSHIDGTTSE